MRKCRSSKETKTETQKSTAFENISNFIITILTEPHAELVGVHPVFEGDTLTLTCSVTDNSPISTSRYQFYVGQTTFSSTVRTFI